MGTKRRNIKNKTSEVVEYWESRIYEGDLGVDWADAHTRCWRCGYKRGLERCHIIPRSLGGSDECDNLVLLCASCHKEAPNCPDSNYMWEWVKSTKVDMYDTFWTIRTFNEFKRKNGRNLFEGVEFETVDIVDVLKVIKNNMSDCIVHYGEPRLNVSTMTWVLEQCEKSFKDN